MQDKDKLFEEVEIMTRLFNKAAHLAVEMLKDGQLPFDAWYSEVTSTGDIPRTTANNLRLIWIWDSIRQDPILKDVFQDLSPAGMRWNRNSLPFFVMKRESWFVIGLSRSDASGLLSPNNKPPQEEHASFQLLDDLYMRPGRNDRLECCGCSCLLQLRPDEVYTKERELDILGVGVEQIRFLDTSIIQIEVPSINQAYMVASRRLEPDRLSHGGNIFEHVVYVGDQVRYRLEKIRLAVELGEWEVPNPPPATLSDPSVFPGRSQYE